MLMLLDVHCYTNKELTYLSSLSCNNDYLKLCNVSAAGVSTEYKMYYFHGTGEMVDFCCHY